MVHPGNPFCNALARFIVPREFPKRLQKALKRLQPLHEATRRSRSCITCAYMFLIKLQFEAKHAGSVNVFSEMKKRM